MTSATMSAMTSAPAAARQRMLAGERRREDAYGGHQRVEGDAANSPVTKTTVEEQRTAAATRKKRRQSSGRRRRRCSGGLRRQRSGGRGRRRPREPDGGDGDRRRLERRRSTAGATATTTAQGYTVLGRFRRRETKARVAAGRGDTGDPFIGARRRRRRPTATGDAKETSGFRGKRPIRFDLESTNFQSDLEDDSKREKEILFPTFNFTCDKGAADGLGDKGDASQGVQGEDLSPDGNTAQLQFNKFQDLIDFAVQHALINQSRVLVNTLSNMVKSMVDGTIAEYQAIGPVYLSGGVFPNYRPLITNNQQTAQSIAPNAPLVQPTAPVSAPAPAAPSSAPGQLINPRLLVREQPQHSGQNVNQLTQEQVAAMFLPTHPIQQTPPRQQVAQPIQQQAIRQRHDEPVQDYIQRFREMRNKCYSLSLTDAHLADLAFQAAAEWVRSKKVIPCQWVKSSGKEERYDFDITKADKIFGLLLREKQIQLPAGHTIPSDEELGKRRYCKWHNSGSHSTNYCKVFRQQIQAAIEGGKIKFDDSKKPMKVDGNPFPDNMNEGMRLPSFEDCPGCSNVPEGSNLSYNRGNRLRQARVPVHQRLGPVNQDCDQEDNEGIKTQWCPSGIFTKNQKRRVQRLRNRERFQEVEQEINHRLKKTKPTQEWRVKNQVPTADEATADEAKRLAKGKSVVIVSVNMVFTLPAEFGAKQADVDEVEVASARLVLSPEQAVFEKPEGAENQHLKPLYVNGYVNGKPMSKMMVDGGAVVNLMPYATFRKLGRNAEDLIKTNMVLKDFGGNPSETKGVLNVELTVGNKSIPTTIFVIDGKGYNQIFMAEEDIHKTAFRCPSAIDLFEWVVMTFGLKSAGATYQRAMNYIYHDLIGWLVEVYIADVVVMSKEIEDHIADLRKVFERTRKYGLKMNPTKCAFGVSASQFLRFLVHEKGIEITQRSVNAIKKIHPPENKTELQEMIGKINFVRRFISNLSGRLEPFAQLLRLKADQKFTWGAEQQKAFDSIKEYLSSPLVLIPPQKGIPFRLRHYLLSNECTVICKADVVKYMLSAPILKGRVGKWIFSLTEFDLRYESPKGIKGQAIADFIVDHRDYSIGSVEAEYEAVLKGLQLLKEVEANAIEIMGDSLLVISQLAGEYECKHDKLIVYNEKCRELMKEFRLVSLKHVSREHNIEANDLAQGASGYKPMIKDVKVEVAALTADDWRYDVADSMGIKLLNSSPYYAQANGQAEASNKSLTKLIKRKISNYPRQWHIRLAKALWSYRMACHGSIQVPPYKLVYGHEAVLPWEVRIGSRRSELQDDLTADEYYNLMADEREDLVQSRLRALAKVTKYKERVARHYNKKVVPKSFSEGELVWKLILPNGTQESKFGKWSLNWE
uniref:OSJNBb0046P18.5 protein n=1 Tax=Oryza sativa subsp. japonica TaxID=39947 RepID=Q7XQ55_ORYSJ|nr:OSJNBb0046P18.5 [Oryza sativa Japonica Group]